MQKLGGGNIVGKCSEVGNHGGLALAHRLNVEKTAQEEQVTDVSPVSTSDTCPDWQSPGDRDGKPGLVYGRRREMGSWVSVPILTAAL